MKKLIATVISLAALSSCIICSKTTNCAKPQTETPNHLMDMEVEETFASLAHGSIQSRQVVALALVHYLDRSTLMKKLNKMEKDIERLKGLED